jgi:hypothetical protein
LANCINESPIDLRAGAGFHLPQDVSWQRNPAKAKASRAVELFAEAISIMIENSFAV